jgi:hypothetical protein
MAFPFNLDLAGAKDKSLSKLLLASARQYLKAFGEVRDLALDTAARSIAVEVLPVGETEPIRVSLSGYGLLTDATGRGWLTFDQLTTSREWLTMVAERALPEKKLPLPPGTPMSLLQAVF